MYDPNPLELHGPFKTANAKTEKLEQLLRGLEEVRLNVLKQLGNVYEKGIPAD